MPGMRERPPIITLLTDFGQADGYPGVMKGVILAIAPQAVLIDLSHEVPPYDVRLAAYLLQRHAPFFPAQTIHLAVVDPGVGTSRRPIAARAGTQYFVGPDNGLLTPLLLHAEQKGQATQVVHLDRPGYWLPTVSASFHGRDIFAPVAAHLARNAPLQDLGTNIHDPVRLALPQPEKIETGWRGEVISVDHFGNLCTNIAADRISGQARILLGDRTLDGIVRTFGERSRGMLVAHANSAGLLEISVVQGSAAQELQAKVGQPMVVETT
jgi:S-adenosylmethionine hydrolase